MADMERQANLARLQSILDSSVEVGVPGIAAAVYTSQGEQCHLHAGFKDIQAKSPLEDDSAFGIGSITKVFVAVVILQLVEESKLSLEDRASSFLDSGSLNHIQNASSARIKDLLNHTGAIASWEDDLEWIPDGRGRNIQPTKKWEKAETLRYVKPSGSTGLELGRFHYANTNYTLLGLVIERITQNPVENEIRSRIIQPLAMTDTYLEGHEQPSADRTPHRYHWATDSFRETAGISPHFVEVRHDLVDVTGTNLSVCGVAGGIISTPSDLLKLAVAFRKGSLLNHASLTTLMDWHEADEEKDIGLGIFRLRHASAPGTWVGHNGAVLGFTGALWWDIDGTCAVSILANVGGSHAGEVPSTAARVALQSDFFKLAAQL